MIRVKLVVFLVCNSVFFTALASNYYISNSGSDANIGMSSISAWSTLARVNSLTYSPGDSILLKRGDVWREMLIIPSSGDASNYITFGSYGSGDNPKILGSELVTLWINITGNIWESADFFDDPSSGTDAEIFFIIFNGVVTRGNVKAVYDASFTNLTEEFDWTWNANKIYVYSATDPNSKYENVEVPQRNSAFDLNSQEYIEINGVDIFYVKSAGIEEIQPTANLTGFILSNCEIAHIGAIDTSGSGIHMCYNNMLIENNIIHDIGFGGISLHNYGASDISNIIIQNCFFYEGYHTTGVDISAGIGAGTGDINNVIFRNNIVSDDLIIDNNSNQLFIKNNAVAGSVLTGIHIYNNVFQNPSGISVMLESVGESQIYFNTFYGQNQTSNDGTGFVKYDIACTNALLKNNIFYGNGDLDINSSGALVSLGENQLDASAIDADFNLYYVEDSRKPIIQDLAVSYGILEWDFMKALLGWETNSPYPSDPLFASPTNYHLQPGSPAIAAGTDIPGYTADLDGIPAGAPPTIGAFQSTSVGTLSLSYSSNNISTIGGNDGSIDITVTGGTPPYAISWSNGAVTEDIGTLIKGDYTVNVSDVMDNKISKTIQITEPLDTICNITANFDYNATDLLVGFSNLTTGVNNIYSWSFGDGNLSNLVNPSHVYVNPGIYDICLTVYDSFTACMKEMCRTIQVGSVICYADFEFYHNADTQGLVHFTSSVGGPVESYYWMFGDGFFSTDPDPSHKFDLPGYYEVSLTVTDSTGNCMDRAMESIQVGGVECNADFSYYIDSETNTAYFTSKDQDDNWAYNWIFGDGSQSTLKAPEHTFKYPGFYKISLSVYDDVSGCLDDKEKTIQVGKGEDIEADFIYQTQSVGTGVRFQDKSLGENLTYLWDFGDRNTSTKPNPVHNYEQGGNYYVCLNIYSANGMQNITCKPIFVGLSADQECQARFAYLVDNASWTVKYTDKSFGSPDTWSWDFGDETAATVKYPEHTYAEADYYTVHLKIQNSVSKCLDHAFKLVNVDREGGLIAGFGYVIHTQVKKADSYPVDFIGVSLGDAGKLKWSFGDGSIDTTSMTPSHDFESGTYKVCLTLSDPNTKESDTICKMIQVGPSNMGFTEPGGMELICYPNPFKDHSTVLFELSDQTWVDLSIYDLMGRKVKQLIREERNPGRHQFELKGLELESGHYYLILLTPDAVERTVITIVK